MMYTEQIRPEAIRLLDMLLEKAETVTVTAHTHPDGDALGSAAALVSYLRVCRKKDAVALLPDTPPDTIRFIIPDGTPFLFHDQAPEACQERLRESRLLVLLDANGASRIDALEAAFRRSTAPKVLIDHHLNPERQDFDLVFSSPEVSSASEMLYQVLLALPDIGGDPSRLPAPAARALMAGMTTDTNNFANSVFPSTLEMASGLLAAGVDRDALLADLYNRYRENRVRLMGYLQYENMRITPEGLAYMIATEDLLERFDAQEGETEGLVNIPLTIDRVKMSIFLKEADGHFRVSIRSKKGFSAQQCALRWFHGGGHENAAGGKLFWPGDIAGREEASAYLENVSLQCLS